MGWDRMASDSHSIGNASDFHRARPVEIAVLVLCVAQAAFLLALFVCGHPPPFLFVAGLLAFLPYAPAFAAWPVAAEKKEPAPSRAGRPTKSRAARNH
jgi:hypothetical protein